MKFQFVLPSGYEKRDLLALNKVVVRKQPFMRFFVPVLRVVLFAFGCFLGLAGGMLLFGNYDSKTAGLACLIVGLIWLLLGLFYFRYLAWRSKRIAMKNTGALTITLTEDGIQEQNNLTDATFTYNSVCEIVCFCDTYFLFADKRHAFILPIRNFSLGTATDFEKFISEKCEKPIKKL